MELLDKLLSLGEPDLDKETLGQREDLNALGLSQGDGEALIAIAADKSFFDHDETWFARIQAWRALAQLKYLPALKPLLPLFIEDSDWIWEELPYVYSSFGLEAIPVLSEALQDRTAHVEIRSFSAVSLELIGKLSEAAREQAIAALMAGLSTYKRSDRELNGSIVMALMHLNAIEAFDLLKAAYDADCVSTQYYGPWPSVLVGLGLKQESDFTREELSPQYKDRIGFAKSRDEFERLRNDPETFFTAAQPPRPSKAGFGKGSSGQIAAPAKKAKKKQKKR